jgi:hypothetical protein
MRVTEFAKLVSPVSHEYKKYDRNFFPMSLSVYRVTDEL